MFALFPASTFSEPREGHTAHAYRCPPVEALEAGLAAAILRVLVTKTGNLVGLQLENPQN